MELLVRGRPEPDAEGHVQFITPDRAGWRYVGFAAAQLRPREKRSWKLGGSEVCVVLIGGRCVLRAGGVVLDASDARASPFDGPPHVLYVPAGAEFTAEALDGSVELAIGSAPASPGRSARGFIPKDARLEMRGSGSTERRIHHLLMEDRDAERLLVTEV